MSRSVQACESALRFFDSFSGSLLKPVPRNARVPPDTKSVAVTQAEQIAAPFVALECRFAIPVGAAFGIAGHAVAVDVMDSESALCVHVASPRRFPEPANRQLCIGGKVRFSVVNLSQPVHRADMTACSRLLEPRDRLLPVPGHAVTAAVHLGDVMASVGFFLTCRSTILLQGFAMVLIDTPAVEQRISDGDLRAGMSQLSRPVQEFEAAFQ